MAEELNIPKGADKAGLYDALFPQIGSVVAGETNLTANLANIAAMLKEAFGFFWVGFYLAVSADELVLGPFQGPLACTRIRRGKGVCGKVFDTGVSLVVPDVDVFPGHIACSSLSKSEVVVPIIKNNRVVGVIDVDSDRPASFDDIDRRCLEKIARLVAGLM